MTNDKSFIFTVSHLSTIATSQFKWHFREDQNGKTFIIIFHERWQFMQMNMCNHFSQDIELIYFILFFNNFLLTKLYK